MTKGGLKGYDKGGGVKGGFRGDGKGGGFKCFGKGYWLKGGGKGGGYEGTCFKCGKVGHKAAECMVHMVREMGLESEKPIGEVADREPRWVVAGVAEVSKKRAKERVPMTLETWMPQKVEINNRYRIFQVEEEKKEAEAIGEIKAEEENGVVRVTVDSGAAKNVWPRSKKGVLRKKMERKPKLAAANGMKIEVYGEAVLEFEEGGRQCGMRFLDSDVRSLWRRWRR